ncbi:1-(5-phosphoribosyl)-5-[(5-phosphoribosylamino)methylideneamino]imidazole-4-carboxamide isomerase [Allocoprobacillus halotolerans]|uniref:1-(5-phosphoribosyl)-5-[(5-phosphoribosylamino)methylideneamino] imidazole-4-carboxamide isomerase n=1 Tax=Allocoprobacillus halotolerans TaxID=2944914 RepID=A0ABY5HZN1_9FIRM|nr:1-(5-phosphoribosyl)-5-[(5-phosphoribosylamino)methylideneamino]imidazole-4-carboxamide isomerase [Allocoprobacillus halotolerans]UTY38270.1 1-(5-phosphoribosyl)-5-[(5-phosphoribosylamino)methylideneamino]imidazole-4-carboxamide isomerase [Allocoprobacillus halotolerans]
MIIIPAIDLKNGEAVRLYKGDYKQKTVYSRTPETLALQFQDMGAKYLHVVDLDGAKEGNTTNLQTIQKIRQTITIPMEVGGGIRDEKTVSLYLDEIGVNRVILGTAAIENPDFLQAMLKRYGSEKIVVGVDIQNEYVATSGWLVTTKVHYLDFLKTLETMGVRYIICTDISKDGTLQGPTFSIYQKIQETTSLQCIVSGGVKDQDDILEAAKQGYHGCIVGKAYYEGKVDLKEVIGCLPKESSLV